MCLTVSGSVAPGLAHAVDLRLEHRPPRRHVDRAAGDARRRRPCRSRGARGSSRAASATQSWHCENVGSGRCFVASENGQLVRVIDTPCQPFCVGDVRSAACASARRGCRRRARSSATPSRRSTPKSHWLSPPSRWKRSQGAYSSVFAATGSGTTSVRSAGFDARLLRVARGRAEARRARCRRPSTDSRSALWICASHVRRAADAGRPPRAPSPRRCRRTSSAAGRTARRCGAPGPRRAPSSPSPAAIVSDDHGDARLGRGRDRRRRTARTRAAASARGRPSRRCRRGTGPA